MICEKIHKDLSCYDFIRFSFSDLNGICRGKYIPARHVPNYIQFGLPFFAGVNALGPRSQIDVDCLKELGQSRCGDSNLQPAVDSIFPLLWTGKGRHRVGDLICEIQWLNGTSQECCPRSVARKQVDALSELGLSIQSSCECEFLMHRRDTRGPVHEGYDYYSTLLFSEMESFFCEVDTQLKAADIDIEAIHTEEAVSQYEIILKPRFGIAAADQVFRLKEYLKEMALQHGYEVSFMTKHDPDCTSGLHFNHSLWNSLSQNVFHCPQSANGLSDIMQYWLGGLSLHAPALTALCSPTVNCYRRLHRPWIASCGNWGIDDRITAFRVKNLSPSSTYVENRLPGGSANPYLVLAGTIAAGLDGVAKRLECPPERDSNAPTLPHTLAEALDALENDTAMVAALGPEFVRWFVTTKRHHDLLLLKDSDVSNEKDEAGFIKENSTYFSLF